MRRVHILYRRTVATMAWFEMSLLLFIKDPDDQVSLQRALRICSKIVWNHGVKLNVGITESAITPLSGRFAFTLLPFNEFPRKCGVDKGFPAEKPECFLAHCVSAKSGGAKIKEAEKMKLNFLANSWESETPADGEPTPAFIPRVGNGNHPRWNAECGPARCRAALLRRPCPSYADDDSCSGVRACRTPFRQSRQPDGQQPPRSTRRPLCIQYSLLYRKDPFYSFF